MSPANKMQNSLVIIAVCLTVATHRQSFVDTAPVSEGETPADPINRDASEQELENLKSLGQLGKTFDYIKSQSSLYTNINGEREAHAEEKEEVKENGETVASLKQHSETNYKEDVPETKVKTELEIPSEGVHKTIIQTRPDFETLQQAPMSRRSPLTLNVMSENENVMDKSDSSSGIQYYSPLDVAEYVFWTGDEKGVTLAIEEFLQEGLMTREEAIKFLQEIKYYLENLKTHYTQLGLNSLQHSKGQEISSRRSEFNGMSQVSDEKPELRSNFDVRQLRKEADKKRSEQDSVPSFEKAPSLGSEENAEDDYDQLLERLRVADFLYTEYSLEEVIYQLAKLMFAQSLTRGSSEAQRALQKFTQFLETEAAQGHISRALEKKVLDVLIASLTDTLSEHPELLAAVKENMVPTPTNVENHNLVKQILNSNLEDKMPNVKDYFLYKEQNKNFLIPRQVNSNNVGHIAFDFTKYKNS